MIDSLFNFEKKSFSGFWFFVSCYLYKPRKARAKREKPVEKHEKHEKREKREKRVSSTALILLKLNRSNPNFALKFLRFRSKT